MKIAAMALAFIFALATGVIAAVEPSTGDPRSPLTTADLFRMRLVSSVLCSPDGSTHAYTLSVPRDPLGGKDGTSYSELWVVGPGGRPRPFVTGEVNVSNVQFTPSGKALAFLAKRNGDKFRSLYVLPLDGGEARRRYEHTADLSAVALHPTLNRIAFVFTPVDNARKQAADRGFSQEIYEEGAPLAQVGVVDLDVPSAKATILPLEGHPSDVSWMPDGQRLLMAVAPNPSVDAGYMHRRLHVLDAQSGEVVAAIDHKGKLGRSTPSPGGKLIAYIGSADEHDPHEGRLMVANSSGGFTKELIPDYLGHFVSCSFIDDQNVLYLADRGCQTVIGRVNVEAGDHRELLVEPGLIVSAMAAAHGGQSAALLVNRVQHPPELYRWQAGSPPKRITDSNPWLATRELAAQEVVRYKARDGLEIEALLVHPRGHVPGTPVAAPVPLVVIVHGGPESHYRDGWVTRYSEPAQILAAKGYAVLMPNYRASTGRGVAFSMLDHKDMAGKEFDDLVDGVDHLVAMGLVDKSKVGVTGGSYGGYASGWCATRYTDRFAASVMGFGVSNLLSMVGVSDIPDEHYLVHHRMHPWEDWQLFLQRSPIYYAHQRKTPILILAGKIDPRVPPSQSLELYRYLKIAGHPAVRFIQYPGEGHGNARAASRLDYHLRLLQWFDHYLKGPGGAPPAMDFDPAKMVSLGS